MMQAYELKYRKKMENKSKGVALTANKDEDKTDEIENEIGLIVKKYF